MTFAALVSRATGGRVPYHYQQRLADEGLPDVLRVPTGTGKTLAATLPWLYRRRHHPDPEVRRNTPRRLVVVLPQRALVEQTVRVIGGWMEALDEADLDRHVLMGGADDDDKRWKTRADRDSIFVGTQDMVLSRLLMRGYAEPRAAWPMSFGLLHADTQFVFDEVQLMGPGFPTSLQLHGLRDQLGTAIPCRSMWMSATLDVEQLDGLAPDLRWQPSVVELEAADRAGPLRTRLDATRAVTRIDVDPQYYTRDLAARIVAEHSPGTRTLAVLNTVDRAAAVHDELVKAAPEAQLVLLHSRFRPADRRRHTEAATAEPSPTQGVIVVSTQVLEAGIDVTSELLVTESAPWSSIVQRAGRCNRDGKAGRARLLWTSPPKRDQFRPYDAGRVEHAEHVLVGLEGMSVTSTDLHEAAQDLDPPVHPILRRRDLVGLFDTAPDLDGNDVDVSQWIRDADDRTVTLAWREPADLDENAGLPGREEMCPAPLTPVRELVGKHAAFVYDQQGGTWVRAGTRDVRPGAVLVLATTAGGYLAGRGFSPASRTPVEPVPVPTPPVAEAIATDPLSRAGQWVLLDRHLADVEREVDHLLAALGPAGISDDQRRAAVLAGRFHDLGKAHPTFDGSLRAAAGVPDGPGPWAKSPGRGSLRHQPPYFRHELVSALVLLDPSHDLLDGVAEPDLVTYLVAAHHGKVRLSARARPDEPDSRVLGVERGSQTLAARLPGGTEVAAVVLSLDPVHLGRDGLTARALRLRDRADVGVFRLAFLESVVRIADWVASASYEERT